MIGRRALLGRLAAGAGWLAIGGPGLALAAAPTDRRLVIVVLRGALDGLAAVAPLGDPHYRDLRGRLALDPPGGEAGAIDLDGFFALHPALGAFDPLYRKGEFAAVHAVATPYRERSHFDAQDLLENGTARPRGAADGWLNRAIAELRQGDRRLGLGVGQSLPLVLRGPVPVMTWQPADRPPPADGMLLVLERLYAKDPLFARALAEGVEGQRVSSAALGSVDGMAGGRRQRGPAWFRQMTSAAGRLLAASDGPRIAVLELGGWDTHVGQGAGTGRLATELRTFAEGMEALREALGPAWSRTMVVAATEFGRTVAINGNGGTDHGTGTVAFLIGGALAGGRVIGRWPGLGPDALHEARDLRPTTDLRALLKGVLADHLSIPRAALDARVFPESAAVAPIGGLVRT